MEAIVSALVFVINCTTVFICGVNVKNTLFQCFVFVTHMSGMYLGGTSPATLS